MEKDYKRTIENDDLDEMNLQITCGVCGYQRVVAPHTFGDEHMRMRRHVSDKHSTAKVDLEGDEILHGYGWTDNQVYVLEVDKAIGEYHLDSAIQSEDGIETDLIQPEK